MSSRMFLPAFLLWVWVAGGTTNSISCGQCEKGTDSIICRNSFSEEQYTIKLLSEGVLLHCQKSARVIDYSLTDDCSFPLVKQVEFHRCPLPNVSFGEIVRKVGVYPENITSLKFIGDGLEFEENLEEWHLQGLTNLEFLELKENYFSSIPVNFLKATPKLKHLEVINSNLNVVPENLFSSTPGLKEINLSSNGIISLPVNLFDNLPNLTKLHLQNNGLREIRSELFTKIPHLVSLDLSHNYIINIQMNLFKGLKHMKELNLRGNKLETIPRSVFSDMTAIEILDLNSNLLTVLEPHSFDNNKKMKSLNIGNNSLSSLPDLVFQKCQSLETLYLNNNELRDLKRTSFPSPVSSLAYLDLGNNNIQFPSESEYSYGGSFITNENFFPLNGQTKLKKLLLNNNKFEILPNSFQRLFINLEFVDLSENLISHLDFFSLKFLHDFVKLDLKNNKIKMIDFSRTYPVSNEKMVELTLEGNPLLCNCVMYEFTRLIQGREVVKDDLFKIKLQDIEKVTCTNKENKVQKLLEVDIQTLTCKMPMPCDNCTCYWRPYDDMAIIDCSYQGRSEIPVVDFSKYLNIKYSITLDMTNNSVTSLDVLQDPSYARLVNLTIPNNKLSGISESYLHENITFLNIRGNNITSISGSMLEFLNVTDMHLMLGNNPWACNCDLIDFLSFLHVPFRKVDDFRDIQCKGQDEPLITISEHSLCPFFMQPMVIVTIVAILIFLILFAVLGTVSFYKYKQGIKVWLFAHHMCLWAITEDEMDADKKYDAFISYSHKDEDFVNKVLVPGLESGDPKYRICLHYRDWIPGEYIQNQILQSVEASRRTIVVLSSNFIESVWGQLEFKAAHSQALQDRTNRLIIIVYGEIPPESELDEKLQLYISMKTYVKWGDSKFWEKLRYIMPHPQDLIHKKRRKRRDTDKLELCKSDSKQSV